MELLEQVWNKATKERGGLESLSGEETLREEGLFQPQEETTERGLEPCLSLSAGRGQSREQLRHGTRGVGRTGG